MNVGDMVVRAYAWDGFIPGIIVDVNVETVQFYDGTGSYDSINFTVAWSDGIMSTEMYEELDYYTRASRFESG